MHQSQQRRIVVVEDDPESAEYITYVLRTMAGYRVDHFVEPRVALAHLAAESCDAVVTDISLPEMNGLEFLKRAQPLQPSVPIIVITAYATVDVAVEALQSRAAGFLRKPFGAQELIDRLESEIAASRRRAPGKRVLAIGAHPDDIEIGAGATLLRHIAAGDDVTFAVMSRGVQGGDARTREAEARRAAALVEADLILGDLQDTQISEGHPTVTFIEEAMAAVNPTVVYTHSSQDVHQDHRNTHRATLVAARRVPAVYCYQSPSATVGFSPNRFVSVDAQLAGKLELIAAHTSQASQRAYMDPDLIEATARYWGRFGDTRHAEAFETVRERDAQFGESSVAA